MTKLDEVRSACEALLARRDPDGSWPPAAEPQPRPVRGLPPELAWLDRKASPALAILAGKRRPWTPFRGRSEAVCVNWLLDHLDVVDPALGLRALQALRFPEDHAAVRTLRERYGVLARVEATAEAIIALQEAGQAPDVGFLLQHPVRQVSLSARVLLALNRAPGAGPRDEAIRSQMEWLLNQQRPDGSWRNPDGSSATATVLETLRWYGYKSNSPRVQRARRTLQDSTHNSLPLTQLALKLQGEGQLTPPQTTFR